MKTCRCLHLRSVRVCDYACVGARACSKLYAPSTNVATHSSAAGWQAVFPGENIGKRHVCSSAKLCNYATASLREIVNIPPQFALLAAFCFRFSVLTQLLRLVTLALSLSPRTGLTCSLHMILKRNFPFVFVFVISPTHTHTRTDANTHESPEDKVFTATAS